MSIKAKAVGKERPRWCPKYSYAYTPKKTKDFEALIAAHFSAYMRNEGYTTLEGPVYVGILVYNKVPNSWSKKKKQDALIGSIRPTKTPDADNIFKAVADGLNKVAYLDDKQIVEIAFSRYYAEEDIINIKINPL